MGAMALIELRHLHKVYGSAGLQTSTLRSLRPACMASV